VKSSVNPAPISYLYFPATAIVSLRYLLESGASAKIAGMGKVGMLGISIFMGGITSPSLATVQTAGYGYRLKTRLMMEEFNRAGPMMRYTQALMTQSSQTAVCITGIIR
jgi:hypothetical protein